MKTPLDDRSNRTQTHERTLCSENHDFVPVKSQLVDGGGEEY